MDDEALSSEAAAERNAIIAEIHAAFGMVTRGPTAMSWQQALAADFHEDVVAARNLDTDTCWAELVDDEAWVPFHGAGGFVFLNVEGFQYYLPPTMIRMLQWRDQEYFSGQLIEQIDRFTAEQEFKEAHDSTWVFVPTREPSRATWTPAQKKCIARFMSWMAKHDPQLEISEAIGDGNAWTAALDAGWKRWLDV